MRSNAVKPRFHCLDLGARGYLSRPFSLDELLARACNQLRGPGVRAFARALPAGAVAVFGPGCRDDSFFVAQEPVADLPG